MSPMSNSEARKRQEAQAGPERWMHHDATVRALISEARQDAYNQGWADCAAAVSDTAVHEVPC